MGGGHRPLRTGQGQTALGGDRTPLRRLAQETNAAILKLTPMGFGGVYSRPIPTVAKGMAKATPWGSVRSPTAQPCSGETAPRCAALSGLVGSGNTLLS